MATVEVLGVCGGGDHVTLRATTAQGTVTRIKSIGDFKQAVDSSSKEEFIMLQIASLVRNNPNDNAAQRKNRIEAYTFLE